VQGGERAQAELAAHVEVEYEHARGSIEQQGLRFLQIACLADDTEAGLGLEHHPQSVAHDRVIVGDYDREGCVNPSYGRSRPG